MTTIYSTASQPATSGALSGFVRLVGDWANGLASYLVRREAVKALRAMNDRELRDIGIHRSNIESAVWGRPDPEFGRLR